MLLRADFNVPLEKGRVRDDSRIRRTLPTIRWLLGRGAKVVVVTHLGRPQSADRSLSLAPVAKRLARLSGEKVYFVREPIFAAKEVVEGCPPKSLILLENIRFYRGEEKNDIKFSRMLAGLADIFVNDAFAAAHRASASLVGVTKYLPAYAGFLLRDELTALDKIQKSRLRPLVVIVGGVKLKDKLPVIKKFLPKADLILTGGGVANTLAKAAGINVGRSVYDSSLLGEAKNLLKNPKVMVPVDWRKANGVILDIGPNTAAIYGERIGRARLILWNGPLGRIEDPRFRAGSVAVALAISRNRRAFSVIGGGETAELVNQLKLERKLSFVSTGGGAMLEYLAGKKLPALEALKHGRKK